jgi:predicted  nucleic acid-binding Zn-ribbon protein
LTSFVKAMNVQQMFAMDKLKATLADAQLQREAYSQECTTLKQKFNALQLEHDELTEKHTTLNQQLFDIDTSDATLESCRKQIQQLRNKISYLEKTVAESNARAESRFLLIKQSL